MPEEYVEGHRLMDDRLFDDTFHFGLAYVAFHVQQFNICMSLILPVCRLTVSLFLKFLTALQVPESNTEEGGGCQF